MQQAAKFRKWGTVAAFLVPVWFVMNVRVELGVATTFERALDGLVGMTLLVTSVFLAMVFYQKGGWKS